MKIKYLIICLICLLYIMGCTNSSKLDNNITKEEEKKYNDIFNNLINSKSSIELKEDTVYYNSGTYHVEYYISENNEEYLYFYTNSDDYMLVYNITKKAVISFNRSTNEYCNLKDNESTEIKNIECENDPKNDSLYTGQTETYYTIYCFNDFLKANEITKEDLATTLKVYYYKNR